MIDNKTMNGLLVLLFIFTFSLEILIFGICTYLQIPLNVALQISIGIPFIIMICVFLGLVWWDTST